MDKQTLDGVIRTYNISNKQEAWARYQASHDLSFERQILYKIYCNFRDRKPANYIKTKKKRVHYL